MDTFPPEYSLCVESFATTMVASKANGGWIDKDPRRRASQSERITRAFRAQGDIDTGTGQPNAVVYPGGSFKLPAPGVDASNVVKTQKPAYVALLALVIGLARLLSA